MLDVAAFSCFIMVKILSIGAFEIVNFLILILFLQFLISNSCIFVYIFFSLCGYSFFLAVKIKIKF